MELTYIIYDLNKLMNKIEKLVYRIEEEHDGIKCTFYFLFFVHSYFIINNCDDKRKPTQHGWVGF
jgi:hypothetical protein